jgi:hypothetical protein
MLIAVEELGTLRRSSSEPASGEAAGPQSSAGNGSNGHGLLRDRLCLLVRQHRLDPARVKRYAAEYCGTAALRRKEFGELVEATTARIGGGDFLPHSGIRFPQNGCLSCPYVGLCLGNSTLTEVKLVRQPGASELDWIGDFDD